jgi:mono/diheme cytochrome c family protein
MITTFRDTCTAAAAVCLLSVTYASAQSFQPAGTIWDGVDAAEEATRGQARAAELCAQCHGRDLKGGAAPALTGQAFFDRWHDLTLLDPVTYIQSAMPLKHTVFVPSESVRAIVAFILRESGVAAGHEVMSGDVYVLIGTLITRTPPASRVPSQ